MSEQNQTSECCPQFDPAPWDGKIIEWKNKRFVKDRVFSLFYMPINIGGVMKRMDEKVRSAGGTIENGMCLSDHTSRWNIDEYIAVDKEIPLTENVLISGKFLTKVYEGDFKDTGKWSDDFKKSAQEKGFTIQKWYMWYTTCPKCAKKYGKNYVVIVGQIG